MTRSHPPRTRVRFLSKLPSLLRVLICLGVVLCVHSTSEAAENRKELLIGLIPEMNVFQQMERFSPLAAYLSENTGVEIRLTMLSRYGNIIEKFSTLNMDGAFFGSFTGALAVEKLGLIPVARPVNADGESTYYGVIFARKGSGIRSARDMKNKRMAFVEKATTAGYIFPLAYLREHGISDYQNFFSETYFAGSHDATIYDVFNNQADVGCAKNSVYERVLKARPDIAQSMEIVATSGRVPSNGLCFHPRVPAELRSQIKTLLLSLDQNPQGREVLKKLDALRFVVTSASDYQSVREMAEKAGISLRNYDWTNQ